MFKGISLGVRSYFKAHDFIKQHKLWGYVVAPGLVNLLLFTATLLIGWHYSDELTIYFLELFGMTDPEEGAWGWINKILRWFFMLFFRLLFLAFYLYLYKYVVLIILSPVLALLSEKVDGLLTGQEFPFVMKRFVKDVLRGVTLALRNLVIEFSILFGLFLLSFIPVLGWIIPFLMLAVEFFFFGFSMIDYSNERKKMTKGESTRYVMANKSLAVANGGVFHFLLLIPVIGIMIGPTYGVVAATLANHETSTLTPTHPLPC